MKGLGGGGAGQPPLLFTHLQEAPSESQPPTPAPRGGPRDAPYLSGLTTLAVTWGQGRSFMTGPSSGGRDARTQGRQGMGDCSQLLVGRCRGSRTAPHGAQAWTTLPSQGLPQVMGADRAQLRGEAQGSGQWAGGTK